ncbi:hypothetical protein ACQP2F_32040 [Actinoplanes sp. CA-030573]|uniref:hypothetical protein n=1 Tax=Actinoplanes sp. CA-030573 TaxID=3239898 RepID=UPI003D904A7C
MPAWTQEKPWSRYGCGATGEAGAPTGGSTGAIGRGGRHADDMSDSPLLGQTVVVIGGCAPAVREIARRAKQAGAQLVITDRRAGPLEDLADEIGVEATDCFDEEDADALEAFLGSLPGHVDHVVLGGGEPGCIVRYARREMRDGGSLVLVTTTLPAVVGQLAAEVAPVRVNVITDGPAQAVASTAVALMIDPSRTGVVVSPGTPCAGSGVS